MTGKQEIVRVTKFASAPLAKVVTRFAHKGRKVVRIRYLDDEGEYNSTVDLYESDTVLA